MSKSLKRVRAALDALGLDVAIEEVGQARTAAEAAASLGVGVAQIANSVIFRRTGTEEVVLFLTSGANRVDLDRASALAGAPLAKADAALVRARTGFAIGGVSPIGHAFPSPAFWDPHLSRYDVVYAAAGTPRHLFGLPPERMRAIAGAVPGAFTAAM
ncbi:MAG: YbaK/EbsC family protein [Shimia sp.]